MRLHQCNIDTMYWWGTPEFTLSSKFLPFQSIANTIQVCQSAVLSCL